MLRGGEWYKQPPEKQSAGRVMSAALLEAVTVEQYEALRGCTMENLLEVHGRGKGFEMGRHLCPLFRPEGRDGP